LTVAERTRGRKDVAGSGSPFWLRSNQSDWLVVLPYTVNSVGPTAAAATPVAPAARAQQIAAKTILLSTIPPFRAAA